MAHRHPEYPYFTREICKRGILQEPFRLIDVGVRGGIGAHWFNFGDHLQAWGFDVLYEQGVAPLIEANQHPDRLHYFNVGLGDEDAIRAFKVVPENPSSSHFAANNGTDQLDESWQTVSIRSLDSLSADGTIGAVDFMKMDAESYEIEIVKGARNFLPNSGIFGVESETTFLRTPRNPRSHFIELYELLAPHGYAVHDAGFHRIPRRPLAHGFPAELAAGEYALHPIGATLVFDFLFLGEIFSDATQQINASIDRLLKMIAVAEIYALHDIGLDILLANRERLGRRFDVDEGADWLIRQRPDSKLTYKQYLAGTRSPSGAGLLEAPPTFIGEVVPKWRFEEVEAQFIEQRGLVAERDAMLANEKRRLAEIEGQLIEHKQQLAHSDAALKAMLNSRAWRITEPLRRAAKWLGR